MVEGMTVDEFYSKFPHLKCQDICDAIIYVLGTPPHVQVCRSSMNVCKFYRVLTMAYKTQNYLVCGLCLSSGILKARKHNVLETGSDSETLCSLVFRVQNDRQSPKTH
jgi:hypothetical protein